MSKKLIIIISAVLTLLFLCLLGYYFIINNGGKDGGGIVDSIKTFLPFGGEPTQNNEPKTENKGEEKSEKENTNNTVFTQKLRKISSLPVSGAGTTDIKAGTIVRYIEKATGHIYEVELFSPKQTRISNTTIPLSYEAVWGNKATSFVVRYLNEEVGSVDTYLMTLKAGTTTESSLSIMQLQANIDNVSTSGDSFFYLRKNINGSNGLISTFDGKKIKEIWNSPIKNLLVQYVNKNIVALNTKPLENIPGYLYFVDTSNGNIKKVIGNILGLTSLVNGDATYVLYLSQGEEPLMYSYNTKANSSSPMSPETFPEKCVWSVKDKTILYCAVPKDGIRSKNITSWYMGQSTYSDDIWKFDIKNKTGEILSDINKESGEEIDVIKPILSDNEQYLIFVNKKDNSLWSLDLTKQQ